MGIMCLLKSVTHTINFAGPLFGYKLSITSGYSPPLLEGVIQAIVIPAVSSLSAVPLAEIPMDAETFASSSLINDPYIGAPLALISLGYHNHPIYHRQRQRKRRPLMIGNQPFTDWDQYPRDNVEYFWEAGYTTDQCIDISDFSDLPRDFRQFCARHRASERMKAFAKKQRVEKKARALADKARRAARRSAPFAPLIYDPKKSFLSSKCHPPQYFWTHVLRFSDSLYGTCLPVWLCDAITTIAMYLANVL